MEESMIYSKILKRITAVAVASSIVLSGSVYAGASSYENKEYSYDYQKDGDYKDTTPRIKNYNGSNKPHGYVYAIASYGIPSSVMVRGTNDAGKKSKKFSEYVTIPIYSHTCIVNWFKKDSTYTKAALRVRTNSNKGATYGTWSPDSSKAYSHIVGSDSK